MMAEAMKIDKETVRKILCEDPNMKIVLRWYLAKRCKKICAEMFQEFDAKVNLLKTLETKHVSSSMILKQQSVYWIMLSPSRLKKARQSRSKFEAMLIVFF